MENAKVYLAADLGASSGRVVAGLFDGQRLQLQEVYRFENGPVMANDHLYWDLLGLWSHVLEGLRAAAGRWPGKSSVASVGVDSWGVDFGLLGRGDELLGNPYHYRDQRTRGMLERAFSMVPRGQVFGQTGLQFMEINTLYQMLAMKLGGSPLLESAHSLLLIPDLFHWLLTGQKVVEQTNASTTQFYNPQAQDWATSLLERLELPSDILEPIVPPGTALGPLRGSVAEQTGLAGVEVVLPGTHDTASAVMGVPAASQPGARPQWCYISSGTWSLMGVEMPEPVINDRCYQLNFTNEAGVGGTTRLLKNIAGLWLAQECRRVWGLQGRQFDWDELVQRAQQARPLLTLVNPDAPAFLAPQDMPAAIAQFCRQTGQPAPDSEGSVIRCVLESLALRYRMVLGWLEELVGARIETIHIVGGGSQNPLLCQMAADACNRPVVAGPVEATAIGNVMMQAVAHGQVGSIVQAREVIRHSFPVEHYAPRDAQPWDEAFQRFVQLVERTEA